MPEATIIGTQRGEVLRFGETTIRIVEDGTATQNRIASIVSTMAPHTKGPPPHTHLMHDECFLVTRGTLRFVIGSEDSDAHAGDYVVVPVGAPHTFRNGSDEPVTFFTTFTPAFYVESFRELAKLVAEDQWTPSSEADVLRRYATLVV